VALISDAGTPGISDPGYELIQQAIIAGVKIISLPGPNAAITALVASGLPTDSFLFLGFPPRKYQALHEFLSELAPLRHTLVFYESPNRLVETLHIMQEVWGPRPAAVARELSKFYEDCQRGPLPDLIQHYTETPPKGEITLIVAGNTLRPEMWTEAQVLAAMRDLLAGGVKRAEAAKRLAEESGWDRRELYDLALD
jgi:16S rRNA (cytidine1402-2'-O)-methyltransferase